MLCSYPKTFCIRTLVSQHVLQDALELLKVLEEAHKETMEENKEDQTDPG